MISYRKVAHANANPVVQAANHRIDTWERPAVEGPQVKSGHVHGRGLRRRAAWLDVIGIEKDAIAINAVRIDIPGMGHPIPIIPIAICFISSGCGWCIKVPGRLAMNS